MKQQICVITGGGSGMGLATAFLVARQGFHVVLAGRTEIKLRDAAEKLQRQGCEVSSYVCDVSDRTGVFGLAHYAATLGDVKAVVHAAGLSPHMGEAKNIMRGNAIGTININDAFYEVMAPGGCLIDTSSMSAYLAPQWLMPKGIYHLCRKDPERFFKKMMARVNLFPKATRSGVAYSISKHFCIWLAKNDAARFGQKGVRILSVTPGNFETPMGKLEINEAEAFLPYNAIKRLGQPEEIAQLYASLLDERLGYLTGTDILCDGGCVAGGASAVRQMMNHKTRSDV